MNSREAKILLGVLLLVASFAAGWRVEYWHFTAAREKEVAAALKQQNDNVNTLIDLHNKVVNHIDALNDATTQDQIHTQLLLQEQNDAINKVNDKLAKLHVGSCTLSPNADSVLLDAYKAAFPVSPAGKPERK